MDCKFCGAPVKNGKCTFCGLDVKEYEAQTHSSCTSSSSYNLNGKEHKKNGFFHWHDQNFDIFSADKKTRSKDYTLDQKTYQDYNQRQNKRTKHDQDVDGYRSSYSTASTAKRSAKPSSSHSEVFGNLKEQKNSVRKSTTTNKNNNSNNKFSIIGLIIRIVIILSIFEALASWFFS